MFLLSSDEDRISEEEIKQSNDQDIKTKSSKVIKIAFLYQNLPIIKDNYLRYLIRNKNLLIEVWVKHII